MKESWAFVDGDEIAPGRIARKLLGGGTVFETYLARDTQRQADVVCKLLRPDQIGDRGARRDLQREATLLSALMHPHVVRLLDTQLDAERPHLVLENAAGPSLRRRIRVKGPLDAERAIEVGLQLAAALAYLAEKEVVHLDVKPGNVVLGLTTRLIDFSVARTEERTRRMRRTVGTAAYMAPEQCLPEESGGVGPAADVWGFGATFYEALCARPPFARASGGDPPPGQRPQLREAPRPLPATIPAALARLTLACLARVPADRPSMREVLTALGAGSTASLRAESSS